MGGLAIALVSIFVIYLLVVSPGFRIFALVLLVGGGLALYAIIENGNKSAAERRRIAEAAERTALSLIKEESISISELSLKKQQYSDRWSLSANVLNNSNHAIEALDIVVIIQDCTPQCVVVGQTTASISFSNGVPTQQMRAFQTSMSFDGLPTLTNMRWFYYLNSIRAKTN